MCGGICRRLLGDIGLAALGFVKCRETAEQFVSLHTEQDAVDRFDNQAFVVGIDHFDQGVTRGVVLLLLGGQAFFCFLPVCLRGRHGVVAVADRIGKEGLGVRAAILLVECGSVAECFKPSLDRVGFHALGNEPAGDMAAVLHQIGVVNSVKRSGFLKERFDNRAVGIVDQDHDVRQLHAGSLAHLETRRDALDNGFFRGTDQGSRAGRVFIRLKIHGKHDSAPRAGAARPAFGQDNAGGKRLQRSLLNVAAHSLMNGFGARCNVHLFQIDFRQGQTQRGGGVSNDAVGLRPIFGLRGILITGDDRPFGKVGPFWGQHDFGNTGATVCHVLSFLLTKCWNDSSIAEKRCASTFFCKFIPEFCKSIKKVSHNG